ERLADGVAVNAARDVLEHFAHQQRRDAASELDHLNSAADVAARFHQCLAMLASDALGERLEILLQQHFELEENPGALRGRGFPPRRKRLVRRIHRIVHVPRCAHGCFGDDFAGGGIVNRRSGDSGNREPFAADIIRAWIHEIKASGRSIKHQHPSSREAPNPKRQKSTVWSFSGAWMLVLECLFFVVSSTDAVVWASFRRAPFWPDNRSSSSVACRFRLRSW